MTAERQGRIDPNQTQTSGCRRCKPMWVFLPELGWNQRLQIRNPFGVWFTTPPGYGFAWQCT